MYSVQLGAGALQVSIQTDDPEVTLQDATSAAHNELKWIMNQHTEIDGTMVGIEENEFNIQGGR
jgi:hypothetical protein